MADDRDENDLIESPAEAEDSPPDAPPDAMSGRAIGLLFMGFGIVLLCIFVGWPIYQVQQGAANVAPYKKGIFGGVLFLFMGLIALIAGEQFDRIFIDHNIDLKEVTFVQWVTYALLIAVAVTMYGMIETYLASLGIKQR